MYRKHLRSWIRLLVIACLVGLLFGMLALTTAAAEPELSGACGEQVTWTLDPTTGHLTIGGTGPMTNYSGHSPWYDLRASIRSVSVGNGVTTVGSYAFAGCTHLTEVRLPDGLLYIGDNAFFGDRELGAIVLPDSVRTVGIGAFRMCLSLRTIHLPASLGTVSNSAFEGVEPTRVYYHGSAADWALVKIGKNNTAIESGVTVHPVHTYDIELVTSANLRTEADCEQAATYYKACICGSFGNDWFRYGEPVGHTGGEASCSRQPVCTVCHKSYGTPLPHTPDGLLQCDRNQTCTVCHAVIAIAPGHAYERQTADPTCTENGYIAYVCRRCGDRYIEDTSPALGHTPGDVPTCTAPQSCTVCSAELAPALDHDCTTVTTLPPACMTNGALTHTCTRCAYTYDEPIPATGHTPGVPATCAVPQRCTDCGVVLATCPGESSQQRVVPPTCTEGGYTAHICDRCGTERHDAFVPATGHASAAPASCTRDETCTACGLIMAAKTGHTVTKETVKPTCEAPGYTKETCSTCRETFVTSQVPATGHKPDGEATCTRDQTCKTCRAILTARLGHDEKTAVTAPTCTESGMTLYTCTRCDHTYTADPVAPLGHTPGDVTVDRAPTADQPGTGHIACNVCHVTLETVTVEYDDARDTAEDTAPDTDPSEESTTDPATDTADDRGTDTDHRTYETGGDVPVSGCGSVGGNLLVVLLFVLAAFLFWYIDYRRRVSN